MERLKLLESEDANERAKGEAMVTPGSILELEGNDESLAAPSEIEGQQLGRILDDPRTYRPLIPTRMSSPHNGMQTLSQIRITKAPLILILPRQ